MKREDAIEDLLDLADRAEKAGIEQYQKSTRPRVHGSSEFGNALHWGFKAQTLREAARTLQQRQRERSAWHRGATAARSGLRAFVLRWL